MVAGTNKKRVRSIISSSKADGQDAHVVCKCISAGPQLKSSCLVGAVVLTMPRGPNNQSWQPGGLKGWEG